MWKVFKRQFPLLDLQRQWPHGMFENANSWSYGKDNVCIIWGILLSDDGRFAIEMLKYWGDLRKFIDEKMLQNNNQSPPFTKEVAKLIMWDIAKGMRNLHRDEILHRDLKAANVLIDNSFRLLRGNIFDAHKKNFACRVADFECSIGVKGTGFWRAPEILLALRRNEKLQLPLPLDTFTKMADVYSYAMTCYEALTGGKPFEGHPQSDYSWVLDGNRPKLPNYIDASTQAFLAQCWHDDPSQRPTFESIEQQLEFWTSVKTCLVCCKAGRTISFQFSRNISCMLLGRHSSYKLEFQNTWALA